MFHRPPCFLNWHPQKMFRNLQQKSPINLKYAEMSQKSPTIIRFPDRKNSQSKSLSFLMSKGESPPPVTQAKPSQGCQGTAMLPLPRKRWIGICQASHVWFFKRWHSTSCHPNFLENFSGTKKIHWFLGMKLPMIPKHQTKKTVGWNLYHGMAEKKEHPILFASCPKMGPILYDRKCTKHKKKSLKNTSKCSCLRSENTSILYS